MQALRNRLIESSSVMLDAIALAAWAMAIPVLMWLGTALGF